MTRSPTRDDLARRVDDLEDRRYADLPTAGLCTIFAALSNGGPAEWVDRDRQVARIDGERYRVPDSIRGVLQS